MIILLAVALIVPFAAGAAADRAVARLRPRSVLWVLTAASSVLGACTLAALAGLVLAGALRLVPAAARLGSLVRPLPAGPGAVLYPAGVLAALALCAVAWTAGRAVLREFRAVRAAVRRVRASGGRLEPDSRGPGAPVVVVDDARPDAFALPGRRQGTVVVTRGMLGALRAGECEVLLAHERAHLAGRHHLFLGLAQLAAHCHPALRRVRGAVVLAAERAADEAAAAAVGDRRLAARAVARAALAARPGRRPQPVARPAFVPSVDAGPVPRRVAALLEPVPARAGTGSGRPGLRGRVPVLLLVLALCTGVSSGAALAGTVSLHTDVEIAQARH